MFHSLKPILVLAACILFAASPALRAYWITDGVPVCTATGNQQYVFAASDGAGGAIVAWSDYRTGTADVYVQRLSAAGAPLWTANGVAICTAANNQIVNSIISDGAGGAIVAWYDGRTTDDIYAQRVNASGTALWTANGVAICAATNLQILPRMIPDGAGGAIIIWQDNRAASANDIYGQRVNASGTVLWTTNGVAICTAAGNQSYFKLASNGAGGAIVTWQDGRSGGTDIYAQRLNLYGTPEWAADGVALSTGGFKTVPDIIPDGAGGAIIAWMDYRVANYNVYAQRVNASGAALWAANGIPVYSTASDQGGPVVISDGAGGAIVGWGEYRGAYNAYAQRVDPSGVAQWTVGGVLFASGLALSPDLYGAPDGQDGAIFSWHNHVLYADDLFAQRVTDGGDLPWGATPATLSAALDDQMWPVIAPDGAGGAVIAWRDSRSGSSQNFDVYAQLVDLEGRVGHLAPDIVSVRDVPGDQGGQVFLSWDAARADLYMDDAMSHYSIWRSIDAAQAALALEKGASRIESLVELEAPALGRGAGLDASAQGGSPAALDAPGRGEVIRAEEEGTLTIYWQLVDTHDAMGMEGYGMPVATLFDSSAYAGEPHYFQVVAHTTDPKVFWKSAAASGWSVDNLPPGAPAGFEGEQSYEPVGLLLSWDQSLEGDFSHYALYRGTSAGFAPGPGNLLDELDNACYFDGDWSWASGYYYKLSAIDVHGNESEFALFSPDNVTGDEASKAPAASYLSQNYPNPFNPTTRIAFGLSAPGPVSLRIYDATGRLVRVLVEGARSAGTYATIWDGRDSRGVAVASGVYFCRLDAGAFTETRKMALLR